MTRLPSLFISHGAPTFAIEPGIVGPALTALGQALPRPSARSGGVTALDDAKSAGGPGGPAADDPRLRRLRSGAVRDHLSG